MDIRTILYINIFLLAGCTVALLAIALHQPRYRQFCWLAIAYATGGASTVLRIQQGRISDFFSLVVSNVLLIMALLLAHRCFANFVKAGRQSVWLEISFVFCIFAGMSYFTCIHDNFRARSLLVGLASLGIAALTSYVLLHFAEADVRVPCMATASLYVVFGVLTIIRCLGVVAGGASQNFFVYSHTHLTGLLGFYVLIVGIPLGYFWMTSARLYARQEVLAQTDPLTGLPNRRGLEEYARRKTDREGRHASSFAVLTIDLDHFKQINDRYGHSAGDAALRMVANSLAAVMRRQDIVARLGGEEFTALLVDTDRTGAVLMAERLRRIVEELEVVVHHQKLRITASFGIAVYAPGDTFESVSRRADRALYAAKLAGRNCVMLDPELVL